MDYKITHAKCLVIKIGSSLLIDETTGFIHQEWLKSLIDEVVSGHQRGQKIILVSSGAIALGRNRLNLCARQLNLEEKQAAASVGQIELAQIYQALLQDYQIKVAQLLLTTADSENRQRFLNAKNTLETLLKLNVIPIINENDAVATAEIRFGDNDRLAARVAQMVGAETLVLLSDIDGFYSEDPRRNSHATLFPVIHELTPEIQSMAGNSGTSYGSGGMVTKLAAAKIAMSSGCKMVIGNGKQLSPLRAIDESQKKTWFIPAISPMKAKKNWLANHLQPRGEICIDRGAQHALEQGKSLLAAGILSVQGNFHKGDPINIVTVSQRVLGRGLTNYPSHEIEKIKGKNSTTFETILGYAGADAVVHRNDLVLLGDSFES